VTDSLKIIVISTSYAREDEVDILGDLFVNGLDSFHLRKPDFSTEQTWEYLDGVPEKYHHRLVLHHRHHLLASYPLKGLHFTEARLKKEIGRIEELREKHPGIHLSASLHHIDDLKILGHLFDYVFLSPIFDSISKKDYKAAFDLETLSPILKSMPVKVIALGGVTEGKMKTIRELGFSGAAVLGAVWNEEDPVKAFHQIKKAAEAA